MDRELAFNLYGYEWWGGLPGTAGTALYISGLARPRPEAVDLWLDLLKRAGITTIGVNEYIYLGAGGNWRLFTTRRLTSDTNDTLLKRIKDAGFKILFRMWPAIHNDAAPYVVSSYGPSCLGLKREGNVYSLNVYSDASFNLLSDFSQAIKEAGVYDYSDYIAVGWGDSGEVDDIRTFANLPVRTRKQRVTTRFVDRTGSSPPRAILPQPREVRFPESHEAMGLLFNTVVDVLGRDKPIGCNRGSCWHEQLARRNLPFFPNETYVQSNDLNQVGTASHASAFAGSTTQYIQREGAAFACDILRGASPKVAMIEPDTLGFPSMNPPGSASNITGIKDELTLRATMAFERNVGVVFTHWGYERAVDWEKTFAYISNNNTPANPRTTQPLEPSDTLYFPVSNGEHNFIRNTILQWRAKGGSVTHSVPIVFTPKS